MSWIRRLLRRSRLEQELDKELRFHIERQVTDLIAQGISPAEAERQARLTFGGLEQAKEACRDVRGTRWLEDFLADCRFGIRLMRRSPGFAFAAVISLALGIGATTAIFSLMDLLMFRTLPVRDPASLIEFQKFNPPYGRGSFSYPLFEQFQRELRSFDGLLATASFGRREIIQGGQVEIVDLDLASGSYYSVLGVSAAIGRCFGREVDRVPGGSPVAVISNGYWRRRFASDPSVVGKTFQLNQTMFTIIGVTPPEFFGVVVGRAPDITLPVTMEAAARGGESWLKNDDFHWISVMGRLRKGESLDQARAEVTAIFGRIRTAKAAKADKELWKRAALSQNVQLASAGNGFDELRRQFSEPLRILMAVVSLVLLIACVNIANLLLAKSAARRQEVAVRLAIGAGSGRIARQVLTEGLLLSAIGGALGVAIAYWAGNGLVSMMSNGGRRMALEVRPDARVLLFALVVSLLACILFSLAPAIQAKRSRFQPALAEIRGGRWRLGKALIISQVAISLLLLIAAGLFGRTLLNMYTLDAGFDRHGVLMFSVNAEKAGYKGARLRDIQERIVNELKTVPGVISATTAMFPPVAGGGWDGDVVVEGYNHAPDENDVSHLNAVGPHFFKTLGTPVLLGREFDERDTVHSQRVAIVNESFSLYYFRGQSPVGRWIKRGGSEERAEIVGVVKNVKYENLRQEFPRTVYFAARQSTDLPSWHSYFIRTARPSDMTSAVQTAVQRVDRALRIQEPRTLEEHVSRSILQERMLATLAGFFGALALLLASVGIYGVMAFQVVRRKKEFGIRLALGATAYVILGMLLGQTGRLLVAGCAFGLAAALALTRLAESMLFGISPTDPLTFVLAIGALTLVAMTASYLPGRGATKLNPADTLHYD